MMQIVKQKFLEGFNVIFHVILKTVVSQRPKKVTKTQLLAHRKC